MLFGTKERVFLVKEVMVYRGRWQDLTGRKYAYLTILGDSELSIPGKRMCIVECKCGKIFHAAVKNVKSGNTKSCGCLVSEMTKKRNTIHGMYGTRTHVSWRSMKRRCNSPKSEKYKDYGGRGIGYDPKWETFEGFFEDMGECPEGLELDRINPDGNYTKENCHWVTESVQAFNQRKRRTNTSGKTGVTWNKRINKWTAFIMKPNNGGKKHLGCFENFDDAVIAREKAELMFYGFTKD